MPDYIPGGDAEFGTWLDNFIAYANANLTGLGLVAGDLTPVTTAQSAWKAAYPAHIAAQQAALAARQDKDAARAGVEAAVRPLVRRLQASPAVDDAERASLGITVPDAGATPVGPPTTRPLVLVECGQRLQHTINFRDEATPTRKAKPPGVLGAEIWVNVLPIGSPTPGDPETFGFVALDTKTPYTLNFDAADGGKNAHYLVRWVNSTGQKGPWSETATATVGA
ncbi:MAG: hypothetical protein KF841_15340 [Phycisphaerae bacterium]|nr:hypothetical protein [Phycisphaerae bacterium]